MPEAGQRRNIYFLLKIAVSQIEGVTVDREVQGGVPSPSGERGGASERERGGHPLRSEVDQSG